MLLCFSTFPVRASETGKSAIFDVLADGLYLEGGFHQYQVPGMFEEYLEADPGFRAGLGFQWRHIRLAAVSGYSRLRGNNPLVSDIQIIPLFGKAGYRFGLPAGFYILPEAGAGNIYTTVGHYWTALDYLTENFTVSRERSFTVSASVRLGWDVPGNFLSLYAGGGADMVIETDSPILMPYIEAGISVKPLMVTRLFPKKKVPPPPLPPPEAPPVPEIAAPVERQWGGGRLWFEPDTDVPLEDWLAVLEAAAGELRRDEKARLTIRGHSAPVGDVASQLEVSRLRSEFCAKYLREAGIGGDRLTVEWFGGERPVAWWDENKYPRPLKSFRCAEIIVDGGGDGGDGGDGGNGGLLPEERAVRFHSAVYFSPDAAEFPAEYRSVLEAAARELARDEGSRLVLRGCAAPVGSVESRLELARLRAEFCKAWFLNFFDFFDTAGIDESRIVLEYEAPPWKGGKDEPLLFRTYRRVEIVVE